MKYVITFTILIITVIITSCSSPDLTTPEGFAEKFLETLKNNDVKTFIKLTPSLAQMKKLSEEEFGSLNDSKFNERFINPMSEGFVRAKSSNDVDWNSVELVDVNYQIESNIKELGGADGIETLNIIFKDNKQNYSIKLKMLVKLENWLVLTQPDNIKLYRSNAKTAENTAGFIASVINPYYQEHPNSESSIIKLKGGPGGSIEIFGNEVMLPDGYSFKVTSEYVIVSYTDGSEGKCAWK